MTTPTKTSTDVVEQHAPQSTRPSAHSRVTADSLTVSTLLADVPCLLYHCHRDAQRTLLHTRIFGAEIFGYPPDRLSGGVALLDLVYPADRSRLLARIAAASDVYQCTYRIVAADGRLRQVWERGRCLDETLLEGVLIDVTDEAQAAANDNMDVARDAERRAWEQEQVNHIVRALNPLDVSASFPVLAQGLRGLTGCDGIYLTLVDETGKRLSSAALEPPYPALGAGQLLPISLSAGREILVRRAHIANDLEAAPSPVGTPALLHPPGSRSRASLPLLIGGEVIGLLNLGSALPHAFRQAQLPILQQIADALAIAIEHSRLFRAERRQRELAERLRDIALLVNTLDLQQALEKIMEQLEGIFPYASGTIQLLEGDVMRVIATRNLAPETLGRVMPLAAYPYNRRLALGEIVVLNDVTAAEAEWVRFEDARHIQSNIGVPLWVRERVIGALTIDSNTHTSYSAEDKRLIQAFAQQAAIAIENARLFTAERTQRELSEALEEAAAVISSALDVEQVLDHILDQVARVVEGDTFNVMMIEDGVARVVRWRGYTAGTHDVGSFRVPIAEYPSLLKMVEDGEPIVIPDTLRDPTWVAAAEREWRRSYVAAPIRVAGETAGFLNVNSSRADSFRASDARRLQAFANHAAIAIQNARLYARQLQHTEQLERRVRERTIQFEARNAWLEAILSSTSDGIIVTDSDGGIVQTNRVAGMWLEHTLSPEDAARLRTAVRDLSRQATTRPDTVIELTGLDLELSAAPISGPGTEGPAVVVAVHDVTYLTALDRMKSQFVSNVSHELRTPITAIRLYCALIKNAPVSRQEQYIQALNQEAERLAKLVEDILEISRIEAGRMELQVTAVNLNALTETVVLSHRILAEAKQLALTFEFTATEVVAWVDAQKFAQVLNNLVENAIHYTPVGGAIHVTTGLKTAAEREWAVVQVADSGMGIPEVEVPQVFDRFFRGEQPQELQIQGSGLGLAIVREIVELHGGEVSVESRVGVGSTFTVRVPSRKLAGFSEG